MLKTKGCLQRGWCLALVLICGINSAQANRIYTNIGDLEAFLDGVMTTQLEQHRIPGAVIAVVHNDEILFAKGYGYANLEREEKVTVNTLFRVGSISKLCVDCGDAVVPRRTAGPG